MAYLRSVALSAAVSVKLSTMSTPDRYSPSQARFKNFPAGVYSSFLPF
jgi:hypothetical protein